MSRYVDAEWLLGVAKLSGGAVDVDDIYNAPSVDICFCKDCKHRPYCCRGGIAIRNYGYCSDGMSLQDNWLFQNWILRSSAEPYAGEVFTIELPEEEKAERSGE